MADDLPARLRAARAFADLTQPELSEAIELGKEGVTYAETERGRRELSGPELLAIADVTGTPRWFLEGGWANYPKPDADDGSTRRPGPGGGGGSLIGDVGRAATRELHPEPEEGDEDQAEPRRG